MFLVLKDKELMALLVLLVPEDKSGLFEVVLLLLWKVDVLLLDINELVELPWEEVFWFDKKGFVLNEELLFLYKKVFVEFIILISIEF